MSAQDPSGERMPSEEELRAAYEEQLRNIRVEDVLVQTVVSLLNLGGRRAGFGAGGAASEAERDLEQVRLAVEGARALLPLVEPLLGQEAGQLRQALSQLQMAYAQLAGAAAPQQGQPRPGPTDPAPQGGGQPPAQRGGPGQGPQQGQGPGDAQRSGRLWVPGQ